MTPISDECVADAIHGSWRTVLLGHILWYSKLTFFGSHLVRISTLVRFRYVPMLFLERSLYVPRTFQVRSRYVPGTFSTLNFVFFAKNVFFWRIYRSHSFPIGLLFQGVHSRWGVGMWDMCTFTLVRL